MAGISQAASSQSLQPTVAAPKASAKPFATRVSRPASKPNSKPTLKPASRHGIGRAFSESDERFRLYHQAIRADEDHDRQAQLEAEAHVETEPSFDTDGPFEDEAPSQREVQAQKEMPFELEVQFDFKASVDRECGRYQRYDVDADPDAVLDAPIDTAPDAAADANAAPLTAAYSEHANANPDANHGAGSIPGAASPAAVDISHEFDPARLEEHRKALMRMARLRVRSHEWAEDAVQEALIAAYQSRASYKGRGSVRSWLRGILDHKIHDRFRAECHYTQADWIDDDSSSAEEQLDWAARCGVMGDRANEDPMEICSRRQRLNRVAKALSDMAPGMREAFILQVVEDRPSLEVANRLGISENNCWIRVHRARKKLLMQRED
jgi:RNA polymerase sigma-70 factor (ECF subfamily)